MLVKDIIPGPDGGSYGGLVNQGGTLLFAATDGTNGRELWQSDGTEAGTTMVADVRSGSEGSYPKPLADAGGRLLFSAADDTHGDELWQAAEARSLSIDNVTVNEGNSGQTNATLTVTATPGSGAPVSFDFATADGSASASSDYAQTSGQKTIGGKESQTTIQVPINGDTVDENNETFTVNLSNASGANTIADGAGEVTITDDDAADKTKPKGKLKAKSPQDIDKLVAKVSSNEDAKAVGTATVSVQTKKAIKSKKAKANVPANGQKKLKFKFKSKALKTIKKAIAKKGKNPKAKLTVTLTDKAGNKTKLKKNVKLKD